MTHRLLEAVPRPRLEELASAPLPTRFGLFEMHVFSWDDANAHPALSKEHIALVHGDVRGQRRVPIRVHSECLTAEVFSSLKCDCNDQLEFAQAEVVRRGGGIILYLRQEGRGIGLANKVRAYALQADGADTIQANELLHLPVDARQYDVAAEMLRALEVKSVLLMTNNPDKREQLEALGIEVEGRLPVLVEANPHSVRYLQVKAAQMRHDLPHVLADRPLRHNGSTNGNVTSLETLLRRN